MIPKAAQVGDLRNIQVGFTKQFFGTDYSSRPDCGFQFYGHVVFLLIFRDNFDPGIISIILLLLPVDYRQQYHDRVVEAVQANRNI